MSQRENNATLGLKGMARGRVGNQGQANANGIKEINTSERMLSLPQPPELRSANAG
jgi:hypothetical protein